MKIKLLSLCSQKYAELGAITRPVLFEYCQRWHIEPDIRSHPDEWDHGMTRLKCIHEIVSQSIYDSQRRFDYLLFMGADVLLTNHTIDIRKFIQQAEPFDILACFDGCGLNNDVLILPSNWDTKMFVDAAIDRLDRDFNLPEFIESSDQGAMVTALSNQPFRNDLLPHDLSEIWKVRQLHQTCNSREGQWTPGMWAYHQSGDSLENKIRLVKEKLPLIVR